MNPKDLVHLLTHKRLSKQDIDDLVTVIQSKEALVLPLLQQVFIEDKRRKSFNASWVLDHLLRKKLDLIFPHLEIFTSEVSHLQWESCIRPMAHSTAMLVDYHYKTKSSSNPYLFNLKQLETITTYCFDWIINERKVATQVFAMSTLAQLTQDFDWIADALLPILELRMSQASPGFKNRATKVIESLGD